MKAKISIGSSAFAIGAYERNPIPFDTVIRRLADLQFDGVELFGARPYGHPDDFPSLQSRQEFHRKLSDLGLEISNYGADLWSIPLGIGDRQAREYEELFKRNLEFCVDVNCHSIRVDTVSEPPIPDGVSSEDAWRRIVTTWRNCSLWAEEAGIAVYWEFEPGFIFNTILGGRFRPLLRPGPGSGVSPFCRYFLDRSGSRYWGGRIGSD